MKCISIRAPLWWCTLYAGRNIDNRARSFQRHTGPVLIHASGWWDTRTIDEQLNYLTASGYLRTDVRKVFSAMSKLGGHIVGVAELRRMRPSPTNEGQLKPWETPGGVALELTSIRPVTPLKYAGAWNLFNVPDAVAHNLTIENENAV